MSSRPTSVTQLCRCLGRLVQESTSAAQQGYHSVVEWICCKCNQRQVLDWNGGSFKSCIQEAPQRCTHGFCKSCTLLVPWRFSVVETAAEMKERKEWMVRYEVSDMEEYKQRRWLQYTAVDNMRE